MAFIYIYLYKNNSKQIQIVIGEYETGELRDLQSRQLSLLEFSGHLFWSAFLAFRNLGNQTHLFK